MTDQIPRAPFHRVYIYVIWRTRNDHTVESARVPSSANFSKYPSETLPVTHHENPEPVERLYPLHHQKMRQPKGAHGRRFQRLNRATQGSPGHTVMRNDIVEPWIDLRV